MAFSRISAGLFFGYLICVMLWEIFSKKEITANLIYGSICIYLLIGIEWAFIYSILDIMQPESFRIGYDFDNLDLNVKRLQDSIILYLYYSYVTMTTLGYGDITPVTPPAQFLAALEAITGQFYLTILVARLVGMQISSSISR